MQNVNVNKLSVKISSFLCIMNLNFKDMESLKHNHSAMHKCLVEWNDINKTESWVNYFALSLSNPKPIISFSRNNCLLDKMPFCNLNQYCRSKTAVDNARILKVSTSPAGIKYKFGIQVPKGIENAIDLDKKNGNQLC
jgi:hypothetical protein